MLAHLDHVEAAEQGSRRRARLLPILGIALIVINALLPAAASDTWLIKAAWVATFALGLLLVLTGGAWPTRIRALMNDELTRAHRRQAVFVGYCAAVAASLSLCVLASIEPIGTLESIRIILAAAIGAPLISFGMMERRALGHG